MHRTPSPRAVDIEIETEAHHFAGSLIALGENAEEKRMVTEAVRCELLCSEKCLQNE